MRISDWSSDVCSSDLHDRVAALQFVDQLLDPRGRDRIERRARLVHQDYLSIDRDRAGDAQPLLLPARQRGAAVMEAILDLVPQPRLPQSMFDGGVELRLRSSQPVCARAISDIPAVRFRV